MSIHVKRYCYCGHSEGGHVKEPEAACLGCMDDGEPKSSDPECDEWSVPWDHEFHWDPEQDEQVTGEED